MTEEMKRLKKIEHFHGERVLLADDDDLNRKAVRWILQRYGLSVDAVSGGKQALERYYASAEYEYQFILLDISMHDMNGCDTARAIRNAHRRDSISVPVYAASAYVLEYFYQDVMRAGMNGYFEKPFLYSELFQQMHEIFNVSTGGGNTAV
ncbi:MAG: response regulator [Clostridiaceae bacterium]|nr:response regulator [Clostridiaceae bacterium]